MKGNKKKIFIEALEQRIMLDGAGASTALDVIDERNKEKLLNKNQKISKLSENKIEDNSQKLPFDQMARDQKRNDRKQVVFIDSQVQDYQTLIDAFNKDTEVYLIQSNEDGFKKIDKVLKNDADISSLHIIGHGSAGKILFGNASLSNDTIKSYNHTLRSIGQSLTEDGDILFYGCNVASTEGGKTLISKISEITKADIAASDDITGKGGDWDLEKKIGIVETKNVRVVGYDHSLLQNGITSINSNVIEPSSGYTKNFQARAENSSSLGNDSGGDFVVVLERENITANTNLSFDERPSGSSASHNPSTDGAVNSYLVIMNSDRSSSGRTSNLGQIVFTNEIYGFFTDPSNTIAMSNISMSSATYATSSDSGFNKRSYENLQFYNSSTSSSSSSVDWISVGSDKRTVRMGTENGQKGDFFRVITAAGSSVSAAANTATVNEDDTITVTNGETTQNQTYEVNDTIDSSTSLTVGSDTHGSGISFSHDGKKMFKTDYQIDQIHQWTLSTAFDPTSISGSPTSANLDFDTSDSMGTGAGDYPVGHAWNSDGTKLFVANWDGVDEYWIHSYDLSTAYDVSTISLVSPSASNSYNTGLYNVKSLAVSSDGTKFYFLEDNARQVRQITFATAYDVTSSASSATLSISDTTYPRSLALSDNGKKLFVGDTSGERIYQYNLTTAWDVSSGVSLDGYITLTTTIDPFGIVFTHGGTKMLVLDEAGETVDVHSLKSPFNLIDIDDEHDGDVLLDDTGSSLTVTQIAVTGSSNSAVASSSSYNSNGTSVTGTYGTLTIGADGSYTYDADQNAADALDAGDIVTDSFTYTTSNGSTTDTATLIITVIGVNDTPVADDEVDSVAVENTETVTDGALDLLFDDTDADASASLSVSSIVATTAGGSATTVNPGTAYNSGYTSVDGSYGTLRIGSDGTYQYTAYSSTGTDVFTYTLFDGSATDEATLTISITNTAPVAQDDTGVVNEDATLVVADGTNLTSVDAATVDGSPLNVASQLPAMRGITFNNDGTKMFLTGQSSDAVSEYHLTTAFDVSTASLDSSFSVSGQESAPTSVKFNDDGTKMFVTGTGSSSIHEYTLSTAFDVSTASLEDSLNVSSKDGNPFGLDFNNDGTKMYFTGDDGNKIYEYNLSTGFDLGTASFNQELSLGSQDVEPFGIEFSPDGTRMFIVGTRDNGIDEYVLTTGFDISTASHVCFLYTRYTNAINPSGIAFSEDGFKMFIVGNNDNAGSNNDQVDEYALVSPFSLCNAAGNFTGDLIDSTNASSRDTDADGQTVTVTSVRTGSSEGNGTGGDVASGSSYNSNGTSVTGTYGTLTVGADGSYSYAADQDAADALDVGDMVTESFNYTVSDGSGGTDIAVLTITINGINDVPVADDETNSVNVSTTLNVPDGTDDVLHGDTDADASSSLTVTGIRTGTEIAGSGTDGTVGSGLAGSYGTLTIAADGTYTYVANASGGIDYFTYTVSDGIGGTDTAQITITVNAAPVAADNTGIVNEDDTLTVADGISANSITNAAITYDASEVFDMSAVSGETRSAGLIFNNDGTKMYHAGNDDNAVKEYHLSTAYDVSTATYQGDSEQLTVTSQTNEPFGITFNNDGSKLYVAGNSNVYQYSLSTAYDVSTGSYDSVSFATGDSTSCGIRFNNDGTKLFVAGFAGGNIEEIHLSTAYDLSTASRSDSNRLDVSAKETLPRDIEFNIDGTRMFVVGGQGKDITEYKLSTAYDVSTGVYVGEYGIRYNPSDGSTQIEGQPFSILFNKMGTKMFMLGYGTNDVHEFELTSPYNLINVKDEHDGDVLGDDTDSDTLTVTAVRTGSSEGSGTAGTVGAALTGTYGQLTLNSNGSYTYVANQSAADALDSGDVVTDSFNYTVSDGSLTDIAVLEITVIGINDNPTAVADTDVVVGGNTVTDSTNSAGTLVSDDTDPDASASLFITQVTPSGGSATAITHNSTKVSNAATISGAKGTLTIGSDGSYSYAANSDATSGDDVFTYTLSDGSSTTTTTLTITVTAANNAPVARNDTGTVNENGTLIVEDGDNASSVTAASFVDDGANDPFEIHTEEGQPTGLRFNNDGTKFFMVGQSGRDVNEYALTTAFDISTSSYVRNYGLTGEENEPRDIAFNSDGTKMFIVGGDGSTIEVHEYALSTAFDISSSSVSHTTSKDITSLLPGGSQCIDGYGLDFNTDGTKFFITGRTNNNVYEFTVSSGFDLTSTVAYDSTLDIVSEAPKAQNIRFNNDGTKMFIVDNEGNDVNEYTLTTGFDISTATHKGSFSVNSQDGTPVGLDFSNDGLKMFVAGWDHDDINEYTLESPFSLLDVHDEHTGDVIDTSSTDNYDTDADGDTLTVTSVRTGSSEGNGTAGTVGAALTGTYGQLTLNANGSYTYVANQSAAEALDPGDIVTDSFNYTVSDGNSGTDIAVIQITVIGMNDAPVADDETNSVDASQTLTVSDGTSDVLHGDTDVDASASLTVTGIRTGQEGGSGTAGTVGSSLTGSYGTLTIAADGTYTYVANSSAGTDYFTYTVSDGNGGTDTAQITITINAVNNAPTASNSTVYISENNQVSSAGDRTPSNITKIFAASDFNFSDSDSDSLSKIKITTLESAGALEYYNGSSWTDVTLNQEISAADIANNYLRFTPAANSESDVTFAFKVHDGTEYSSSAYTMTISVNAAPNVTDTTVGSTVSAGGTSSGDVHDNVADSDDADSVLVVTGVASGNESSNNTIVTNGTGVGSSVTGTYGTLNIAANGTYTYTANATNNIAFGATATDTFTFTTRDDETNAGSFAYDVGTITFTVASSIALVDDTDSVNEDATVTKTGSEDDVLNDDTADSDGLVITHIKKDGGTNSTVASGSTYVSNGTSVTGTYGTLTIGADGSYTYVADQAAADALDAGDQVNDIFVYTADGATANLTITVTGVNDAPVAVDDTDAVNEDATITVDSGADLLMADDSDADDSSSITVTQIAVTGGSDSAVAGGSSYNSSGTSVTGTYGTLTVGADGTYTYTADQSAADALDAGDTETDSFTYTISDGTTTTTATLIITVTGVNDRPTAGNETIYINENNTDASFGARTSQNITHTFADSDFTNYSDADADDGVGIRIKSLPTGTLSKISNGATQSVNDYITNMSNLKYTPPANSEADDSFTYRAYDGTTAGDTTRTITISVNAAPVAVNDTDSITAGDADATGNVLTNDTDADDAASALAIRGVGAVPESSTMLANANVGSAVTGTYGNLTISYGGAYAYSVSGNANTVALRAGETATDVFSYKVMDDETNAGSKAIDIGTITFTITGIDGDAIGEPDPDEPPKLKEKKKDKKQKREERKELKRLKREKRLERKELKIPKSNLEKNAEFNQGLKLVDLVAESKSLELKDKDKDIYLDKIIAKYSDKNLKVKFKVFDDEGKEVQKYYGEMKDGSPLPDWIKVDPKTGKTKTDIPKGVKMVEFKIIAIDTENNKKQVTVVIDAKKIAQDKEILKQSRKIERAKKLEVTNDGSVKLNSINEEGKIDKTKTEAINEIKEIDELVKTIEPDEFLNLEAKVEKENFEVELPWQNLRVVLNNGQELPEWIKYDPKTGKVTATPPENVKTIDLKVIIENPDGELSVKDIKLNFVDKNAQETKNISDNETKFVSLSSQLSKEYSDWDNYGSQLIDRL